MDFDLRLLKHARALAEEGSFGRAARTLHITQPALSRSIRDLEARVGIAIFDRTRTRVVPTDLGRAFLDRAGELLAHAESLGRDVAQLKGSSTGTLNVGAGTYPAALFMGQAMAAFMAGNPGVSVRVSSDNWANLVAMLRRRELDLVVAHPPSEKDATDLEVTPLARRQGFLFVRPGHPLAGKPSPTLADIAAYPLATTVRVGPVIAERLRRARGDPQGRRAPPDFGSESFTILKAVVRATDHVLLATYSIVADDVQRRELVALPIVDPGLCGVFAVLRLRDRTLPAVADDLRAAVVAADRLTFEADRLREAEWVRAWERAPGKPRPPARQRVSAISPES